MLQSGRKLDLLRISAYAVVWLFFLQLLAAFVAANYAQGLLNNEVPPESASTLLLLAPLLLLLKAQWPARLPAVLLAVMLIARLVYPFADDVRILVFVSGVGVACFLLLLTLLFARNEHHSPASMASALTGALALALAAHIALRAFGSGLDPSMSGSLSLLAWPLAGWALWQWPVGPAPDSANDAAGSSARVLMLCLGIVAALVLMLCLGIVAALVLVYFAFSAPYVMARWTREPHMMVLGLTLVGLVAWLLLLALGAVSGFGQRQLISASAIFGVVFVLVVRGHQISFPDVASAYPLREPSTPGWLAGSLVVTLLLWPVVLLAFQAIARQILVLQPSLRQLALSFGIGGAFLGLLSFAQILTSGYDYLPTLGPVFRDRFWIVIATPTVLLLLGLLAVNSRQSSPLRTRPEVAIGALLLAVLAVSGAVFVQSRPEVPDLAASLTVVTFNVEQGYGDVNQPSIDGQLKLLRSLDADIIGLQESETSRVSGANNDLVRYYADRLNLHSYSGPKTVTGTFGIALLSRYPIEDAKTFYLYSEGEQTAVIVATVRFGDKTYNVFVTHLGNGGPLIQQSEILSLTQGLANVLLIGDFNFRPGTEQYAATTTILDEAWTLRWPTGEDAGGSKQARRIDYVFLSPGTEVREAEYIETTTSDHPALLVEIAR